MRVQLDDVDRNVASHVLVPVAFVRNESASFEVCLHYAYELFEDQKRLD